MSAPLRYARILNGFSFLISRRSAISPRIRAIATLSKPQTFCLDPIVEHARAAYRECAGHPVARVWRTVAEQTAAASRSTDFGGSRACRGGQTDQPVDGRRRHTRRQPLAVLPFA